MPHIAKTIVPRIKKSLRKKGVLRTAWACLLGPYYLIRSYRGTRRNYAAPGVPDEFDLKYGVETGTRVHLTDLKIESPNWIYAGGYWPTPPGVIRDALSNLGMNYEDFTFIDLGSGKGRVLLLASDYPFREIIGVEFSSELHAIAQDNIRRYQSSTQKCRRIVCQCMDFTQFQFPRVPLFVFLYNPSSEEITKALADNLARSLKENPRPLWVLYVTPTYDVFESGKPFSLQKIKSAEQYALYSNGSS
jgi:hypothetical protein